jgi:stage V sporulation protein G
MQVTEVRIKLMEDSDDRLQAFCSITFDDAFVVRDLKIIEGTSGPFVAMPSRKLTAHCPQCGCKNHLRASYCNQCGLRLSADRAPRDAEGRTKLYADIAHPINSACRELIQNRVIAEYRAELDRAEQPGYVSRYDEDYEDAGPEELNEPVVTPVRQRIDQEASTPAPHTQSAPKPVDEPQRQREPQSQQREPHGPHRTPPPQQRSQTGNPPAPATPRVPPQKPGKGGFGAGVF